MAPYYVVEEANSQGEPKQSLVSAKNPAQAISAVVTPRFSVRIADPEELITLTEKGIKVVKAGS
jgi:hypothetical protein